MHQDEEGNLLCNSHNLYLKAKERWMRDKSAAEYLSSQSQPFITNNDPYRSQIANDVDTSDILNSVIPRQHYHHSHKLVQAPTVDHSVFQDLLTDLETDIHSVQKPGLTRQQLFESLPTNDRFVDGVLKVEEAPHAKAFKTTIPLKQNRKIKHKRSSGDFFDKRKTTCMLYLQADHLFYQKMGQSEEACIEVMTRHVQRVNSIYRAVGKVDIIALFYRNYSLFSYLK